MRRTLLGTFDEIYVLDLHGSARRKERAPDGAVDKNVFDIRQGVAITIFVKHLSPTGSKRVFHRDVWGLRETKETYLAQHTCETVQWQEVAPQPPDFLFVPQDVEISAEYRLGTSIVDIMDQNGTPAPGLVTTHDSFAVSWDPDEAVSKVERLLATQSEEEARSVFKLCGQSQWNYDRAKRELSDGCWRSEVRPLLYKPFDFRWPVYNPNVAVHRR